MAVSGTQICALAKSWIQAPSGSTPITVNGLPSSTSVEPTMAGSAAKRERQKPWLRTTTWLSPGSMSPRASKRPTAGCRRWISNHPGVATPVLRLRVPSGSCRPKVQLRASPNCSMVELARDQSSTFGGDAMQ